MTYRKEFIEVALPLDGINSESARAKPIQHGHPLDASTVVGRVPARGGKPGVRFVIKGGGFSPPRCPTKNRGAT